MQDYYPKKGLSIREIYKNSWKEWHNIFKVA
jgi:hypothetical protein